MTVNLLITGGAGFIGSHLTQMALSAGYHVRILDNLSPQIHGANPSFSPPAGVEFQQGNVTSRNDLEHALKDITIVVHLAAETGTGQSMYEIDRYYRVNVQGTALLFDIMANSSHSVKHIVLSSSRSVYGEGAYSCTACDPNGKRCFPQPRSPKQLADADWTSRCPKCNGKVEAVATHEDDRLAPASIYAATKLAQEDLVRVGASSMGIGHSILRFQNVYGEGQSLNNPYTGILSIFSTRIRLGLPLPIFEDGEESRDFVHVEDVAAAVMKCIGRDMDQSITANIGAGESTSIMHVSKLLCRIMNSSVEPYVSGQYRIGDIRHNFADIARLKNDIGFHPKISLEQGMERFCNWVTTQAIPQDLLEKANQELKARNLMG